MITTTDHIAAALLILAPVPNGDTFTMGTADAHTGQGMSAQSYYALVEHLTAALKQLQDAELARLQPAPEGWNPDDSTVAS